MQKKSFIENFTISFFWFAFAVFLLASAPHIATYFRHFSGDVSTNNWLQDDFDWVISWLIAIVIDASEILVSIALMKEQKLNAGLHKTAPYWLFVIFIMGLSWFINWQYNLVYQSTSFHTVDSIKLPFWTGHTIGDINPAIGGCFVVLMLVYSGMAHKFRSETLEEINAQNAEMEKKKDAIKKRQDLLKEISGGDNSEKKDAIDSAFDVAERAKNRWSKLRGNKKELAAKSSANSEQNVKQIVPEIVAESANELATNSNKNHDVNSAQFSPELEEQFTPDLGNNSMQNPAGIEQELTPNLEQESSEKDVSIPGQLSPVNQFRLGLKIAGLNTFSEEENQTFEDLLADAGLAEEPEEPETEPLVQTVETSEERSQVEHRNTGSYRKLSTSAHKAVASPDKFKTPEEIAELEEVKQALGFAGRGAALKRLQVVNEAINSGTIRPYAGSYSRSSVVRWLDSRKVRTENVV